MKYFLRTLNQYRNAPIGTVFRWSKTSKRHVVKVAEDGWMVGGDAAHLIPSRHLSDGKRPVVIWGGDY